MNEEEAREIVERTRHLILHERPGLEGFSKVRAEGYLEAIEKAEVLVTWIESLGIESKKDILDWWKKEK